MCFPHFDSPSVFASILDDKKGGHFKIGPATQGITHKQFYWPETNILITRFLSTDGVGEITDYMPVGALAKDHGHHQVVRRALQVVSRVGGRKGHNAREFFHLHSFASDSRGNFFIGEVNDGHRYYRWRFTGMGASQNTTLPD